MDTIPSASIKSKSRNSTIFGILFGVVISGVILYFLLSGIDWNQLSQTVVDVKILPLIGACGVVCLSYVVRALRWKHLLPSNQTYTFSSLIQATAIGFLGLWVLPLRAGEFVRPWVLSKIQPVSFSAGFASIVIERVFDVFALLVMFVLCSFQVESVPPLALAGMKALGVISVLILVFMLGAYVKGELMLELWSKLVGRFIRPRKEALAEKLCAMAEGFIGGLKAVSNKKELAWAIFWSLVLWVSYGVFYWLTLVALGEGGSVWPGFVVAVMVALAIAAPSAPGFLGTFQLGCVAALSGIYQFDREFAIAFSIIAHILQASLGVLLGAIALQSLGLRWKELRQASS